MSVQVWEEEVVIPTYEIGEADKNPMFLEKRVYQGSSGKVYPYPTIDTISRNKTNKSYRVVFLENDYIQVMVMPELGGRIQRAYDKTNDYDFVYYNHVIKPALVGLTGPWISGGIEFNWPQHHRPTTFLPVDYRLRENADGSKSVMIHDVDQMYGTKAIATYTLYPDKAYIEIEGQLYNRTPLPQTFLWWANPAVAVNEHTQSIFPPDVHYVMDHGKRDVSRFPIARGIYYKHDYSEGVDISRYNNIPVPTSYMAESSEYDFIGGYDYEKKAGLLHVADHHIAPGKKQWTWGYGDFGQAWDRILTDDDGPYVELMTGVYTDNQPDFSWLKPYEEKRFKQYFMPYKSVGRVKNATVEAALNLEWNDEGLDLCIYTTSTYEEATVIICTENERIYEEVVKVSPTEIFDRHFEDMGQYRTNDLYAAIVYEKRILVEYIHRYQEVEQLCQPAQPAKAAKRPEEIKTNEELYLTGQHIEQYRHATYLPDDYYQEGLKRDPMDSRINNAYGMLYLRRGDFMDAKACFDKAISRLTHLNPNPYNSEAYYNLGLVYFYQQEEALAYKAFYKATWSNEQQEMSFYYLAVLLMRHKDCEKALEMIDKALVKNGHNMKARGLRVVILRDLGRVDEAVIYAIENQEIDAFDYYSMYYQWMMTGEKQIKDHLKQLMRGFDENYLMVARDMADAGLYEDALHILSDAPQEKALVRYYQGYYSHRIGREEEAKGWYKKAEKANPMYCFPNKLEDLVVLEDAITFNPKGGMAYYYLGNLFYDKRQFGKAIGLWEACQERVQDYPTVYRNLALAYYNKEKKQEEAKRCLEKAFELDMTDARVFLELDQLYKKLGHTVKERLWLHKKHMKRIISRDDLYIEHITLLNIDGQYEKAYEAIMSHEFRPWEGGEGRISTQYKMALLQMAENAIQENKMERAKDLLKRCLTYPENLGEGKLEGTKDNHVYYMLGKVEDFLNEQEEARYYYAMATEGVWEPAGMMYYYDQPADMILYQGLAFEQLDNDQEANRRFYSLIEYGQAHLEDVVTYDYFAVSLPDFYIFDEDLTRRNRAHCYYLMGLGYLGLRKETSARHYLEQALLIEETHQKAKVYIEKLNNGKGLIL